MFGDISKTFGRSFLTANLLPSGFLCTAIVFAMKMKWLPKEWATKWPVFGVDRPLLLLILIFVVAVLFSLFSRPITRIYEGYSQKAFAWYAAAALVTAHAIAFLGRGELILRWPIEWLLVVTAAAAAVVYATHEAGRILHRVRYKKELARSQDEALADHLKLEYKLARQYPHDLDLVLPTKFGNVLRAFEHYPRYVFSIEPITMWFRLMAVVPDPLRTQLENAEAVTLFFLNLSAICVMVAFAAVYVAIRFATMNESWGGPGGIAILLLAGAYGLYGLACVNAAEWGESVRSAFDLYRFVLLRQLAVHTPEKQPWSLKTERTIWKRAQRLTFYAEKDAPTEFMPAAQPPAAPPKPDPSD